MKTAMLWRMIGAAGLAFTVLTFLYLVVPTLVILPISFSSSSFLEFPPPGYSLRWYAAFFGSVDYRMAILNSVAIGVPAAALAAAAGTLAALAIARGHLRFRRILAALILAPLILPQIVLAIGLFPLLARLGLIGTYPAIVLGHGVVTMPFAFITVTAVLQNAAPNLELAAMTLGATPWRSFRFITLPIIRPAIIVGALFAFTFSFDELILAMFLTSPATRTVPRLLWEQLNYELTPEIAAATTVLLGVTIAVLIAAAIFSRLAAIRTKDAGA
jgi:ABC-type spermidine/putrescine transport system permease subunit II